MEALKNIETLYREAIQVAGAVPYYQNHKTESYDYVGEEVFHLTGYTSNEFTPSVFQSMIQSITIFGEYAELPVEEAVAKTREQAGNKWKAEYCIRTKNMKEKWLVNSAVQMSDESGNVVGSIGILQDITEIKLSEMVIRENEERMNLALKSAKVGTWSWNVHEDFVVWDEYMHPLFGIEIGEFNGTYQAFLDLLHPDDQERVNKVVQECLSLKKDYDTTFRVIGKKENVHHIAARGKVYLDEKNQAERMAGVCWDISKVKETEIELRSMTEAIRVSNEELEQFAFVATHDLNEPLRMVTNFLQLLENQYKDQLDETAKDYIHFAVDGSVRMKTLINDLLAYSRISRKGKPLKRISLMNSAQTAVNHLHETIKEKQAVVSLAPLPDVMADSSQMIQLFQNLIVNALKYCEADRPLVQIASEQNGSCNEIHIKDNGIGIDDMFHEKIFMIFKRLHSKEEYPGTGIGLAICKKIMERHNGNILLESKPGEGSIFKLIFPVPKEKA